MPLSTSSPKLGWKMSPCGVPVRVLSLSEPLIVMVSCPKVHELNPMTEIDIHLDVHRDAVDRVAADHQEDVVRSELRVVEDGGRRSAHEAQPLDAGDLVWGCE